MRGQNIGFLLALSVAFFLGTPASDVRAQWIEDGTPLCTASGYQYGPDIIPDGVGGAIVTWADSRNGGTDIYAQRLDALGGSQWTVNGVVICAASGNQYDPVVVSDGAEGAIITWRDYRSGSNYDIYAQRVDASGAVQWTANGVALCTAANHQEYAAIESDGAGGAIVAWRDYRTYTSYDIYAQSVDASGTVQWTANGVALCTAAGHQYTPDIATDGEGGAIVTWSDYRSGNYDIYAQSVDASGAVQWTADGVALCTSANTQENQKIISDEDGGAIVVWRDYRSSDWDIYAQRVSASGAVQWTVNGLPVCTVPGVQSEPALVPDGHGGAITSWRDAWSGNDDIFAQRISASGTVQWTANGVPVCAHAAGQTPGGIVSDGVEGAVVVWRDDRGGADYDIYAQRLDASGSIMWLTDGVPLTAFSGDQWYTAVAPDGAGGAIVAWRDDRNPTYDTYAQKVTHSGYNYWYGAPTITSIQDVEGDQGGQVWIDFQASQLDNWPEQGISFYSVWRSVSLPYAPAMVAGGAVLDSPAQAEPEMVGNAYYSTADGYWQLVATIDAYRRPGYGHLATTLRDSTSAHDGYEYFMIAAHGTDPMDYFDSLPDSGYSVDNLAPCAPAGLAAELTGGTQLTLHWDPNSESDLSHYAIYRGTSAEFVPDEENCIGTATACLFVDEEFGYGAFYYKVSAIDIHENEGPFATLSPDMIVGVPEGERRYGNVLFQNAPNPFLSSTRIAFSLKEAGHVRLSVFDVKGRLVRVLVDEIRQANQYVESWDGRDGSGRPLPAGTYFYNLEAPDWKASKKMTLAR